MSVPKHKRKLSPFEVRDYVIVMRKEVTKLILQDFGYRANRFEDYIAKSFSYRPYDELNEKEKNRYDYMYQRLVSFNTWFIEDERKVIVDSLRNVVKEVNLANSIYPTSYKELKERRIHQELALGYCYTLTQELQYAIETLPVDMKKYDNIATMISYEISLLEGWRRSDNKKFKKYTDEYYAMLGAFTTSLSCSGANFANVNNNGNANYNNASNSNGVRPDFDTSSKRSVEPQGVEKGEKVLLDE